MLALWLYGHGLTELPARWEEPRRAVVAFEMIYNHDFVVPTVLGEPYTKKPPLQNWLIAAFAGWDPNRVDAHLSRFISVLAVLATAGFLTALASRPGQAARWRWLPGAIYATTGITLQYGRSGEIDPLFVFWTTGALYFFDLGQRRRNEWIKWVPSQVMVAGGVLTKGLAPLFFYPPLLLWGLVERRRASDPPASRRAWLPLSVGLAAMLLIVSSWMIPYALSGSLSQLIAEGTDEIVGRTPAGRGPTRLISHLAFFPFEILGNLLPWSLLGFGVLRRDIRQRVKGIWEADPYLRLLIVAALWTVVVIWAMPGGLGRYVMPAYPLVAAALALVIERSSTQPASDQERARALWPGVVPWIAVGAVWVVLFAATRQLRPDLDPRLPVLAGLVAIGLAVAADNRPWGLPRSTVWLLTLGFLYGGYYSSVTETQNASRDKERNAATQSMARTLIEDARLQGLDTDRAPVTCDEPIGLATCFEVMKVLGRPLQRPERDATSGYLITRPSDFPSFDWELVAAGPALRLWRR